MGIQDGLKPMNTKKNGNNDLFFKSNHVTYKTINRRVLSEININLISYKL